MMRNLMILTTTFFALGLTSCASRIYQQEGVEQLAPSDYLSALETSDEAYLLDIRTPMEYRKAHLEGAVNINFISFSFGKKIKELDADRPVFIYCHTAHRSPFVAKKLHKRGFTRIVDLEGGYRAMKRHRESMGEDE